MTQAMIQAIDPLMMQRCLDLAVQAQGKTAPNPLVGCVIVRDNEIVGEGFHPKAGEPHAEVFALRQAGDRAKGATLYVNLEPCSHYGRTPPCADAVIAAGVQRVVVGMVDPNPQVAGRGLAKLREAGIGVTVGVEEAACQTLNEAFVHRMRYQRPFGILKYAMTLDGKIATTTGHSAWVSSDGSRSRVHQLRATCEAVIVGGNTVRQDNPLLTSRRSDGTPLRVVMSRSLELPGNAQLWDTAIAPTLVFTEPHTRPDFQDELRRRGVEVIEVNPLIPSTVMQHLYDRAVMNVLWECGGTLAAQAIAAGAVQKLWVFIAPKLIGGVAAPSPIGDLGLTQMSDAYCLDRLHWETSGADLFVEGYLSKPDTP